MGRFIQYTLQTIGLITVLTLLFGFGLMAFAGYWMNVDEEPFQADYILPLAGDEHRHIKSAELYNSGYAPTILLSNAVELPPSRFDELKWNLGYPNHTRAQLERMLFQHLGAGAAKLEPFGDGHISTVEEVEALKAHLNGQKPKILVVTSPYHARRAKMIFERILPGCPIRIIVTDEGAFKSHWWTDQLSAKHLIMEFAKTAHYLLGGVFRSTD